MMLIDGASLSSKKKGNKEMKVVVNRCYGGFGLSEKAYRELDLEWDGYGYAYNYGNKERTDPKLIEVVEKLGEEANGEFAFLKVIEIPDDIEWFIDDYDGVETIREKHRSW
jgi:hypothetical protein